MASVFITGGGVRQAGFDLANLSQQGMPGAVGRRAKLPSVLPVDIVKNLAREDRAILSDAAVQSLLVSNAAYEMAQKAGAFSDDDRAVINVYSTAETVRDFYEILYEFRLKHSHLSAESIHEALGRVAGTVHPLRLFRKLPTNNLYHIAKYFGFTGGGYPLRNMSLGGLSLLEHAVFKLDGEARAGALLCAVGDMTKADNFEAFRKMGLVESDPDSAHSDQVVVTHGAVALMLENAAMRQASGHVALAEITGVYSRFDPNIYSKQADWEALYQCLPATVVEQAPVVILYDNGAPKLRQEEQAALQSVLPHAHVRRYKPATGYAGSTGGLIDLACALADTSIEVGRTLLVNGMGIGVGCACAVIKKLQHMAIDVPLNGEAP
ncbi:Molybdopterin biosynthesis protein MoeA [Pseudomonas orientalis]|uniref:hypothetical protein n=1 Tax=Pseudomonas orientalis TaxID=76758 RepID=UPI000F583717|nr:hypothetical protein [Pseudomonas orientalis]AZE84792.1 Molybdopterin biosynthesis protein MoeA [Pseudomonas orientalis]